MGTKFLDMLRSGSSKFLSTQDFVRLDKNAHTLKDSAKPEAQPYKSAVQLRVLKGAVYIVPAKPGKKAARDHQKALNYIADHLGSLANQLVYGGYDKNSHTSNATKALTNIAALRDQNTGRATLDQLCAAWRPVSNAQQCAAATKRSGDVQQRAQQLQWQPRQYGGGDEVGADGFVVNGRGCEEFERAAEWSAVLTSECERIAESPKKKKALEKHFKGGPVSAFKPAGRGNTVLLGGAAGALQQALLVEPYKRINLLLAQVRDAHKIEVLWSDTKRDEKIIRHCETLMPLIRETIERQAQMGHWLIKNGAPQLPGRLGQSVAALGVSLVNLSLHSLDPDSDFMKAGQWAAETLHAAQMRLAARKVGERAEALNTCGNTLLLSLDSPSVAAPTEPPLSDASSARGPEAEKAQEERYRQALAELFDGVQRLDDWRRWGQLPSQRDRPDAGLDARLRESWAAFASDQSFAEEDPFDVLQAELPQALQDAWDELKHLSSPTVAGGPDHEAILACSERIVQLTAVYQKGLAVMSHGLMAGVLGDNWSPALQRDALEWGNHMLTIGEMLSDPTGFAMAMVGEAHRQGQKARAALDLRARQRGYLGAARRSAAPRYDATIARAQGRDTVGATPLQIDAQPIDIPPEPTDEKARRKLSEPTRPARRLSEASARELDDMLAQLENPAPRRRGRALSQDASRPSDDGPGVDGKRRLKRQPRAQIRRLDGAIEDVNQMAVTSPPRQTRRVDSPESELAQLKDLSPEDFAQWMQTLELPLPSGPLQADTDPPSAFKIDTPRPADGRSMRVRRPRVTTEAPDGQGAEPSEKGAESSGLPMGALHRRRAHRRETPDTATLNKALFAQYGGATLLPDPLSPGRSPRQGLGIGEATPRGSADGSAVPPATATPEGKPPWPVPPGRKIYTEVKDGEVIQSFDLFTLEDGSVPYTPLEKLKNFFKR